MSVDAAGEQELRAVQADAFGAGVARRGEVVGELDVGVEPDRARRRRSPPAAAARPRPPPPGGDRRACCARAREHLVGRIEDHLAGVAVDDDQLPRLDALAGVVQADDRRHVERAREDRGVIRPAAGVGREAADLASSRPARRATASARRRSAPTTRRARAADRAASPRPGAGSSAGGRRGRRRRPCARAGRDRRPRRTPR